MWWQTQKAVALSKRKNPHAVSLGRRGGKKRMAALSPEERSALGKLGGRPKKKIRELREGR